MDRSGHAASVVLLALLLGCATTGKPARPAPAPLPPASSPPPPSSASPSPDVERLIDILSPLVAIGTTTDPSQLSWDEETRKEPAGEVLLNLRVLGAVNPVRFMEGMGAMPLALGAGCEHCHDEEAYDLDTLKPKTTARAMLPMAYAVDRKYFAGTVRITCWTCHRGEKQPRHPTEEALAARARDFPRALEPRPEDREKPAETVFRNIQALRGTPAGEVKQAMASFSVALGVGCEHCHVPGAYEKDDLEPKRKAREMLAMRREINDTLLKGVASVGCHDCHHGEREPRALPAR